VGVAIERRATDFDCGAARARAGARVLSLIAEGMVPGKK
jgi:hypothetical protein